MEAQNNVQRSREKKDLQYEEKPLERKERAQQDTCSIEVGDAILKEANEKLQAALKNKGFRGICCSSQWLKLLKRRSIQLTQGYSRQGSNEDRSVSKRKQSIINILQSQPSDPKSKKSWMPMWKIWNCDSEIYSTLLYFHVYSKFTIEVDLTWLFIFIHFSWVCSKFLGTL